MSKGNIVIIPKDAPKVGEVYRHYKGDFYKIVSLALHSNDEVWMVIYEAMYDSPDAELFVQPVSDFNKFMEWNGKTVKRFTLIEDNK